AIPEEAAAAAGVFDQGRERRAGAVARSTRSPRTGGSRRAFLRPARGTGLRAGTPRSRPYPGAGRAAGLLDGAAYGTPRRRKDAEDGRAASDVRADERAHGRTGRAVPNPARTNRGQAPGSGAAGLGGLGVQAVGPPRHFRGRES